MSQDLAKMLPRRKSSTPHYQTFPTSPPHSAGPKPIRSLSSSGSTHSHLNLNGDDDESCGAGESGESSPIPKKQLAILAIISLAEQTTLNSIAPYLPEMVGSFPGVDPGRVGVLVGAIASSFAAAQFGTNFFWGKLSDRIGRKPVVLLGILFTAANFVAFGFCKTLPQAIAVQMSMGAGNGNQALISTMLGEITDQSNQAASFKYLPVIYGIGGIIGPIIGGVLVGKNSKASSVISKHPYMLPNMVCAAITVLELLLAVIMLEESLEEAKELPPLTKRLKSLFSWLWQFTSFSRRPTYLRHSSRDSSNPLQQLLPDDTKETPIKEYMNGNIILMLVTFTIFSLSNVAFNTLYPVFSANAPPAGRGLSPRFIGVTLSFASAASIVFQVLFFDIARSKLGNKLGFAVGCLITALSFFLMPLIDIPDPEGSYLNIYIEVGTILLVKTLGTIAGLTCFLLLLTNASPSNNVLGSLNGLAQTLGAGGRAVGPLLTGGLFSAVIGEPKADWITWSVFGSVAAVGGIMSLWVRGKQADEGALEDGPSAEEVGVADERS